MTGSNKGGNSVCIRCGCRVPDARLNADGVCAGCVRAMFSSGIRRAFRNLDDIDEIARGVHLDWTIYTRDETDGILASTKKIRTHLGKLNRMGGSGNSRTRRSAG